MIVELRGKSTTEPFRIWLNYAENWARLKWETTDHTWPAPVWELDAMIAHFAGRHHVCSVHVIGGAP